MLIYKKLCNVLVLGFYSVSPKNNIQKEKIIMRTKKTWDDRYSELRDFFKLHGHGNNSRAFRGTTLYLWILEQQRNKDRLLPSQIRLLDRLNFDWDTKEVKLEKAWNEMFDLLKTYKQEHGDTRVKYHGLFRGKKLGSWCAKQKATYKLKKLPAHRIEKLESIGFDWGRHLQKEMCNPHREDSWNEKFEVLSEYKERHGDTFVPQNGHMLRGGDGEEYSIGTWVTAQRMLFKDGRLPTARREKLESIGFVFVIDDDNPLTSKRQQRWEESYAKLVEFKRRNGTCDVPKKWEPDPALANWAAKQRLSYSNNTLSEVRFQKLSDVGFQAGCVNVQWSELVQKLQEFKQVHGHCRIPCDDENSKLERWIKEVRRRRNEPDGKSPILKAHQKTQLDELGFEWNPAPTDVVAHTHRSNQPENDSPRKGRARKSPHPNPPTGVLTRISSEPPENDSPKRRKRKTPPALEEAIKTRARRRPNTYRVYPRRG